MIRFALRFREFIGLKRESEHAFGGFIALYKHIEQFAFFE